MHTDTASNFAALCSGNDDAVEAERFKSDNESLGQPPKQMSSTEAVNATRASRIFSTRKHF